MESYTSLPKPELMLSEEKYIHPLNEILNEVTSKPPEGDLPHITTSKTLSQSLNELFPEQQYEDKAVQRAKDILGDLVDNFTQQELKELVAQVQYLAESWLDDFEREVFNGLTLKELLHEKGGL